MVSRVSRLRFQLMLAVVLAVVPGLIAAVGTTLMWRRHLTREAEAAALRLARHASSIADRLFHETRVQLAGLGRLPGVAEGDMAGLEEIFASVLRDQHVYGNIGLVTPDGTVLAAARPLSDPTAARNRRIFRLAAETGELASDVQGIDASDPSGTATLAFPVPSKTGQVRHVLFATITPGWTRELEAEAQVLPGTVVKMVDETGSLDAGEPTREEQAGRTDPLGPLLQDVLASGREATSRNAMLDGVPHFLAVVPLGGAGNAGSEAIAVAIPIGLAIADSNRFLVLNLLVPLLAAVAAVLLSSGAANVLVVRRVKALVAATRRLSAGDLGARAASPGGTWELRELEDAFDAMASALQAEVDDRRKAEEAIRKLSRAIEQTGDSVFITDRDGVIEYVNPSFERHTGYSSAEAVGATPRLLNSGVHENDFFAHTWNTLLAGETVRAVFVNKARDGRLYHEDKTISPIRDGTGQITHFVSTGRDITQRRRTEEALRRMNDRLEQETTRIAGVIHDEAGQLLTAAHITLSDALREATPPVRERLLLVKRTLDDVEVRMRRLAHELHPRVLDDLGLVEAIRFLAEGVARRTGIDLSVKTPPRIECPRNVQVALYRLVQEALTNLARHAGASRAQITLDLQERAVHCAVQDDGIGFEATLARPLRLGLDGIRDRLEAVGGELKIVSAPGEGTELRAKIPLGGCSA